MKSNNLCSSCTTIGCEFQSGIVRTKCAFYMPPHIETDNCGNYVVMQPADDTISRQMVLDIVEREQNKGDALSEVEKLSSVNPQPKTGHWIKYGTPRCGEQHYQCTSCGYYINFGQWGELYTKEFKYCPNCGCKMAEPQERSE